jgi:type IX secretion system PorP/SprF family membrane protein
MTRHRISGLIIAIAAAFGAKGQDLHFSQYAEMPSIINPALAGVVYNTRIIANFRDQWSAVTAPYRTIGLAYEQTIKFKKLKNDYFAVAANIFRDEAGDAKMRILNPNLGFAYHLKVNRQMKASMGIQSGFTYKTVDYSKLTWDPQFDGYQYDPTRPTGEPETARSGVTAFDYGVGVNLNFVQAERFLTANNAVKFDVGAAVYHFKLRNSSFIQSSESAQPRICTYFNGDFAVPNSINAFMPSILFMKQGGNTEVIAGALFKFIIGDPSTYTSNKKPRSLAIGSYYRFRDAIIPTLLFQYNKYAFGLSYDINVSPLTPASNRKGGIEFMVRYNLWPGYGVNLGRKDAKASY